MEKREGVFTSTLALQITGRGCVLFGNITEGVIANGMIARLSAHGYERDGIIKSVDYVSDRSRVSSIGLSLDINEVISFLALDWAGKEVEVYSVTTD